MLRLTLRFSHVDNCMNLRNISVRNCYTEDPAVETSWSSINLLASASNINSSTLVYLARREKATESRDRKSRRHCSV